MGIDCRDVHQIVHIRHPEDVESDILEIGRAGYVGQQSLACNKRN